MKICEWCGKEIPEEEYKGERQKYHKECCKKAYRKSNKENMRKKRRKARDSKTLICAWCGEEIPKEEYNGRRQKYHKECAKIVIRKQSAAWGREYRIRKRKNKNLICAWCGEKINWDEISNGSQKYHKECRPLWAKQRGRRRARRHRTEQYKYIYFLQASNGLMKIGRTANIKKRIHSIQCMSPVQLTVLYVFHGPEYIEKDLHDKFEHLKSNVSPIHTEWFYDSLEIHEEIESLKKQYGQVKIKLNAHADK